MKIGKNIFLSIVVRIYIKVLFIYMVLFSLSAFSDQTLKLATTTSTYETGLLDYIFPPFEKVNKIKIHVISVGTGKAIKLGENGDVDIILVHAREAEDKFVKEGFGVNRHDVMYNYFIVIGPESDPADIFGFKDVKKALKRIYASKSIFVSRGDDSGTHKKEKKLWSKAGIIPEGKWYLQTGQGMSATLRIADEKNAYILIDRATYLFQKSGIRLKKMVDGDRDLFNPYGVIAVNPAKYSHVNYSMSIKLIDWLVSDECQKMIGEYKKKGYYLFHPKDIN